MPTTTLARPEPTSATRTRPSVAAVAATALAVLYAVVVLWTPGRLLDQALLVGSRRVVGDDVVRAADTLLGLVSPVSVALALAAVLAVGVVRDRWRVGAVAVATVPLALAATEVLKLGVLGGGLDQEASLLPGTGSFPSGHVTVVAAVALAAVRVASARRRAAVRLLALLATALVGVAVVLAGWHRPGDVVAGVLVAGLAHEAAGRFGRSTTLRRRTPTTTGVRTR